MKKQIIEFYNDPDFQRLNSYYNRTTIFNILNIERRELSHSAFLKWLFDINGSHNLNDEPLKKLLRHITNAGGNKKITDNIANAFLIGDYTIKDFNIETEKSVVGCENKGRIDIFANFGIFKKKDESNKNTEEKELKENIVLVIENKIDASESNNQTMIYSEWVKEQYKGYIPILIFLNPNGEDCSSNEFITISYQDILEYVIEPLLNMETNDDTKIILEDYIVNLGQPKKQVDGDEEDNDLETILAVSKKNKETFSKLLGKYEKLLNASLVAKYNGNNLLQNIFGDELSSIKNDIKEKDKLLSSFWDSNNKLLRMMFLYGDESDENLKELLKTSVSKPIQYFSFNGKKYRGRVSLCRAIVKDYIENIEKHRDVTIEELRKTFDTNAIYKKKHVYFVDSIENAKKVLNSKQVAGGNYDMITTEKGMEVMVWGYWPDRFYKDFEKKLKDLGYVFE